MPKEILLTHIRRYPLRQPEDAVKLLYPCEFGGGHLIQYKTVCLDFLRREYDATPPREASLLEALGDGMVRGQLAGLDAGKYPVEQLGQDFIRSAAAVRGSMDTFQKKLAVLKELTRHG